MTTTIARIGPAAARARILRRVNRQVVGGSLGLLLVGGLVLLLGCGTPGSELAAQRYAPSIRWLQRYLRIDTTNPPGREHHAAEVLAQVLREAGLEPLLLVTPSGRTNLYTRLRAESGVDGPALLLLHHMDVVAPGDGWDRDPFSGDIEDGRIWGRGALDAKSLGIAHLAALVAVARDVPQRQRDIIFIAAADEERGGLEGTGWLLDRHPELFAGVEAVLNEGGANRQVNERLLWWGIEVAQKRPLWLEIQARGRAGHAAGFNPRSAVHTLVDALHRLLARPLDWRVCAATRTYLASLAPLHNDHWRPILGRIDDYIERDGPTTGLIPGMPTLFLDTVQVTVLDGAEQINVIPPTARARVDVRMLPDTDADRLLAEITTALGTDVEVEVILTAGPAPPSSVDSAMFRNLEGVLGPEAPVVPFFSPGFTDSRFFRSRGIAAYGFSPFALEPQELRGIHDVDESLPVDEFLAGVERTTRLVRRWAEGAGVEP